MWYQNREIIDKLDNFKIKNFSSPKDTIKEGENKLQPRRKYLQIKYLTQDLYTEYLKTPKLNNK